MRNFLINLIASYNNTLAVHPIKTKVATNGTIMTAADLTAQTIDIRAKPEERKKIDLIRTARMTVTSALLLTPLIHHYYNVLDRFLPGNSTKIVLKKLTFDQAVVAPLSLAAFLSVVTLMETRSMNSVGDKLHKDWLPTLKINYAIWPVANYINFQYVPLQQRILYGSTVGYFWGIILAYMANKQS